MAVSPLEVVRTFYAAAAGKDATALADLLAASFHEDAAVEWPAGLPYGGRVEGVRTLRKVFAGLTAGSSTLGPEGLEVVSVVDGGDQVAAQVTFDFRVGESTIPSGALELWTFEGGLVKEVRAYYWDTEACASLFRTTHPA
ncbi:nuclear transport factor 2 family protein [Nocardioides sp. NPDC101246]|uniref:nuclear transport factor 2 family protein n=1 Tax=Nocardioides sp. NPDC101246 TaxID=3364336 RepID=UPI0038231DA3